MAFVDTLLAETNPTILLLNENHQPSGHSKAVYPLVRPSTSRRRITM